MRKVQRNLRKKAKEEKKTERRLTKQGDSKNRVKVVKKKVFRCMESVDAAIRKVLGKTAKTRVVAKSRVKEEEVNKCAPGSNSSMRSITHEARQERKVKMRGSGGSRAALVTQQETCNVGSLPDHEQVTISDVGMEEWLEAPTSCDQDGQLTLDLSGPEQRPMEPMPPCMEFFQVHSEHLCSPTAHLGMWPKPPPVGFPVPPIYCPVSAEIICGPRRPLAQQPAPQCFLLTKS